MQEFNETTSNGTTTLNATATYLAGPRGVEYRQDASGARSWYLYDGLGSVIAEVNEGNESTPPQVTASRSYDVYGAVRSSDGSSASSHKFCGGLGHTADDSTGLTYMRARYYDPAIGRFISEDPAGDGVNWYAYCESNPTNAVDASGQDSELGSVLGGMALAACLVGFACGLVLQFLGVPEPQPALDPDWYKHTPGQNSGDTKDAEEGNPRFRRGAGNNRGEIRENEQQSWADFLDSETLMILFGN